MVFLLDEFTDIIVQQIFLRVNIFCYLQIGFYMIKYKKVQILNTSVRGLKENVRVAYVKDFLYGLFIAYIVFFIAAFVIMRYFAVL